MISTPGFKCDANRHLCGSGLELAVYNKICAVTWKKSNEDRDYYGSIQSLAEFFGKKRQSVSRAVRNLIKNGWLEERFRKDDQKSGHELFAQSFGEKVLVPVEHPAWVEHHGNTDCFRRDEFVWYGESKDALAVALHVISRGHTKWHPEFLKGLRKTGVADSEIEKSYREHVAGMDKEPKNRRRWQRDAGYWMSSFIKSKTSSQ